MKSSRGVSICIEFDGHLGFILWHAMEVESRSGFHHLITWCSYSVPNRRRRVYETMVELRIERRRCVSTLMELCLKGLG